MSTTPYEVYAGNIGKVGEYPNKLRAIMEANAYAKGTRSGRCDGTAFVICDGNLVYETGESEED